MKCGRGDFAHSRRMRIRIVVWNLVFSLMFTCVTGTSLCSVSPNFLKRLCVCVRARVYVCVRARNQKLDVTDVRKIGLPRFTGRDAWVGAQCRL